MKNGMRKFKIGDRICLKNHKHIIGTIFEYHPLSTYWYMIRWDDDKLRTIGPYGSHSLELIEDYETSNYEEWYEI